MKISGMNRRRIARYRQKRRESTDVQNADTLLNLFDDLRQLRQKPLLQSAMGSITDAKPDDYRAVLRLLRPLGKVLVFGNNRSANRQCVFPDNTVIRFSQPHVADSLCLMSGLTQPAGREGAVTGRQPRLNVIRSTSFMVKLYQPARHFTNPISPSQRENMAIFSSER